MAYICENCGKGITYGVTKSHRRGVAGKRWRKRAQVVKRTFKPNLQKKNGKLLCASCIKKLKKNK